MVEALEIDFDGVSSETVPGEAGATFVCPGRRRGRPGDDRAACSAGVRRGGARRAPCCRKLTDPLKTHRAHVVISAHLRRRRTPSRSDAVMAAMLFAAVAASVLELPTPSRSTADRAGSRPCRHVPRRGGRGPGRRKPPVRAVDLDLDRPALRRRGVEPRRGLDALAMPTWWSRRSSPQTVFALLLVAEEVVVDGAALRPR